MMKAFEMYVMILAAMIPAIHVDSAVIQQKAARSPSYLGNVPHRLQIYGDLLLDVQSPAAVAGRPGLAGNLPSSSGQDV